MQLKDYFNDVPNPTGNTRHQRQQSNGKGLLHVRLLLWARQRHLEECTNGRGLKYELALAICGQNVGLR